MQKIVAVIHRPKGTDSGRVEIADEIKSCFKNEDARELIRKVDKIRQLAAEGKLMLTKHAEHRASTRAVEATEISKAIKSGLIIYEQNTGKFRAFTKNPPIEVLFAYSNEKDSKEALCVITVIHSKTKKEFLTGLDTGKFFGGVIEGELPPIFVFKDLKRN